MSYLGNSYWRFPKCCLRELLKGALGAWWNSQQFCICWIFISFYIASKLYWNNVDLSSLVVVVNQSVLKANAKYFIRMKNIQGVLKGETQFWVRLTHSILPVLLLCLCRHIQAKAFQHSSDQGPFQSLDGPPQNSLDMNIFWSLVRALMSRSPRHGSCHFTSSISAI